MADIIGREGFRLSQNDYDWLGDGVYFFQDGSLRAWQWARERHGDDAAVIGQAVPTQSGGAHPLDREVINYAVSVLEDSGTRISCVHSAFPEGRPVYPGSAFYGRSHVQIAVRDTEACIRRIWRDSRGP